MMLLLRLVPNFVPNICITSYPAARSQLRTWSLKSFTSNFSTNHGGYRCSTSQEACWLPPHQKGALLSDGSSNGCSKQVQQPVRCQVGTDVDGATEGQPADEVEFTPAEDESAQEYVDFCTGEWAGTFTQYDFSGKMVHRVSTQLTVVAKEDDSGNPGLQQTLKILQVKDNVWKEEEAEVINKAAMDRKMQLGVFKDQHALALQHQSAEVIDKVLRVGILGADNQEEEFPEGVKLPSRRPALVSESCLYSEDGGRRIRAFHVLDPRGLIDTIGVFEETRSLPDSSSSIIVNEEMGDSDTDRLEVLLGRWQGSGVVNRSGLYGATSSEQGSQVTYISETDGSLVQELRMEIGGQSRTMTSKGEVKGCMISFNNFQMILLPGGITMSSPTLVGRGQAFYFETGLIEKDGSRRRLVRTFDPEGMVVSTTLYSEKKTTLKQ